jgi:transcriptional regulator with XRE-family HTH domain
VGRTPESKALGARLKEARRTRHLSRRHLAATSGLSRRTLAGYEGGRATPTDEQLNEIAQALGTTSAALHIPQDFTVPAINATNGTLSDLRGDAASDALLREYLAMVRELRNTDSNHPGPLRQDDLQELARALGGTPEEIEVRLKELLNTNDHDARHLRTLILPSLQ